MKAIRVKQLRQGSPVIGLDEMPEPVISRPDEVIVRTLAVGLDGTDREILREKYGEPPDAEDALIIGHESLGVVVQAGAEAVFQKGDLVAPMVRRPCKDLHCVNCRNGQPDFCQSGRYTERGIKGANGFLAEYYKEEDRYLVQVPADLLQLGVLAEPQSIVEKVWDQIQRVQQRMIWEPRTALILGAGPLGLLAALTCRMLGMDVYVWSKGAGDSLPAQIVRDCGAEYRQAGSAPSGQSGQAAGQAEETLTEFVEQLGKPVDLIMECTGYSPLAFEAISVLGPNGVLALLGVTPADRSLEIPADLLNQSMVLENKCVIGSVNASRKDFEIGLYRLEQIERKYPGQLQRLLTDRFELSDVPALDFDRVQIKAVVELVPTVQWKQLVRPSKEAAYSFSV